MNVTREVELEMHKTLTSVFALLAGGFVLVAEDSLNGPPTGEGPRWTQAAWADGDGADSDNGDDNWGIVRTLEKTEAQAKEAG